MENFRRPDKLIYSQLHMSLSQQWSQNFVMRDNNDDA